MWLIAKFITMRSHDFQRKERSHFWQMTPHPRSITQKIQMSWPDSPYWAAYICSTPIPLSEFLKPKKFQKYLITTTLRLHIPGPRTVRGTDLLSRNAALNTYLTFHNASKAKTNQWKGPPEIMGNICMQMSLDEYGPMSQCWGPQLAQPYSLSTQLKTWFISRVFTPKERCTSSVEIVY